MPDDGSSPEATNSVADELVERILEGTAAPPRAPTGIVRREGVEAAPLSHAQQRLWFVDRFREGASKEYNIGAAFHVAGHVDPSALEEALGVIVRRHEVLRTRFATSDDGRSRQIIQPWTPPKIERIGLRRADTGNRDRDAAGAAMEFVQRPFDLEDGPVYRCALIQRAPDDHVVVFAFHHIVFDAPSVGLFLDELTEAYKAVRRGIEATLPPLPVQFSDFAAWERGRTTDHAIGEHLQYWIHQLAEVPTLKLPLDRPRPARQSFRGARLDLSLDGRVADRLARIARDRGASMFMVILAAFHLMVGRYAGQQDVSIGIPVTGRSREELARLIGPFANTLVIRTRLEPSLTVGGAIERVRDTCLDAFDHGDVPFERLVAEIAPLRDPSTNPLFQVACAYQEGQQGEQELEGRPLTPFPLPHTVSKFDLNLTMARDSAALHGSIEYDRDLFDEETVERMGRSLCLILEQFAASADTRLGEIDCLGAEERVRLLALGTGPSAADELRPIIESIWQQVRRDPERTAVVANDRVWSYQEVEEASSRLARALFDLGVRRGHRVAIALPRSAEAVIAQIAVMRLGAAYVPLDPQDPEDHLDGLLKDSGAGTVVTRSDALPPRCNVTVGRLDLDHLDLANEHPLTEDVKVGLNDLAYVMYTSGSTGRPKGVCVPHRGIARLVHGLGHIDVNETDAVLHFAPASFDASTFELWAPLAHGGRIVVAPPGRLSLEELGQVIHDHRVTVCWLTAPLFNLMVDHHIEALRHVRHLVTGGDVVSPTHVQRALETLVGCTVTNGYGPTENTTFTTLHGVERADAVDGAVQIGRPVGHTRVYVLDAGRELVPAGVVGELYAAGDGLATGYLGNPALTEERFLPDPFAEDGQDRMYRTGDLARWRPDGTLDFVGRVDDQVKVRGHRVEPGEIERRLEHHGAVREATVLARDDGQGTRLVAYVTLRADSQAQSEGIVNALLGHLRDRVPGYMVPARIMVLDAFPLTGNGKIDRDALPDPESQEVRDDVYLAPRSELERRVAAVWADVLGMERVSVGADFFDLGGHSLLAMELAARLRSVLSVPVPVRAIFENPTIGLLSKRLEPESTSAARVASSGPRSGLRHKYAKPLDSKAAGRMREHDDG